MAAIRTNPVLISLWYCLITFLFNTQLGFAQTDTLQKGQELKQGQHLFSSSGLFRLGFAHLGRPNYSYLAIWYNADTQNDNPVWIANRGDPVLGSSGILELDRFGSLRISQNLGSSITLYHDSARRQTTDNVNAVLLDTGNFVLREYDLNGSVKSELWRSFDSPTDTLLPGMKLGFDKRTGLNRTLRSWSSQNQPASGSFALSLDSTGPSPMLTVRWRERVIWTGGVWESWCFASLAELCDRYMFNFSYVSNEREAYFSYLVSKEVTIFPRITLSWEGGMVAMGAGSMFAKFSCIVSSFDSSRVGCVESEIPVCRRPKDKFVSKMGLMSRYGFKFGGNKSLNEIDCWDECFKNCSCVAYASADYENGTSGCEIWTKDSSFTENNLAILREIHILESGVQMWWIWLTILVGGTATFPLLFSSLYVLWKKYKLRGNLQRMKHDTLLQELGKAGKRRKYRETRDGHELQIFSYESISTATIGFSETNKLGEGGFGPVYKGQLIDGQEVAIKRLSRSSGQGLVEFKNEALLIAKLQHTNLVRLLGFCIQGDEKMLVYEYMPNKSLDFFLFDDQRRSSLTWKRRFHIIEGVSQGLVYLHKYSRLKVIHRDLKASNILLDKDMNPKIADFGMARIFSLNESEENTGRVVGTYGYMSAEYALKGVVSVKTDVFSFGVTVLEIISGKKNNKSYHSEDPLNLIGYAWNLWNEERWAELVDPAMSEYPKSEVMHCIHLGLLCVQDQATDRPTMPEVVSMLSSDTNYLLPRPKKPAFFIGAIVEDQEQRLSDEKKPEICSVNDVTMSVVEAR